MPDAIRWENNQLHLLDQTLLPREVVYVHCRTHEIVCDAIRRLAVRGAPAIGVAAAYGLVVGAMEQGTDASRWTREHLERVRADLAATRPTAVNLFWALERMWKTLEWHWGERDLLERLAAEACAIHEEDIAMNRRMGGFGAALLNDGDGVLTHCNAGALATGGYGTALGVIRAAVEQGKRIHVYADETRPLLQGARLTAYELAADNIPVTLICDGMAASLMRRGEVKAVIVGSDRTVANGDVANKIGTYGVAVLAKHHGIPFYVALPSSTIDLSLKNGDQIPIEERRPEEVRGYKDCQWAADVPVWNPAFDVTPHELVSALITEKGVIRPPYDVNIPRALRG
ncbi:MAG: S-methyl-5-thioribose-1-phosphate isomerase [Myxococcales bacterium]|nr:MAG: S-methyl-5-thioribose-1-phosphate isomerase [Myxococcales bacterium]